MEREEIIKLTEDAIEDYFAGIDDVVDKIVNNIIETYGLTDEDISEDDKKFIKERIMRGILKWDNKEDRKTNNNEE